MLVISFSYVRENIQMNFENVMSMNNEKDDCCSGDGNEMEEIRRVLEEMIERYVSYLRPSLRL